MSRIIVLRTGDTPPPVAARRGQYFDWIRREVGGAWEHDWLEHDVRHEGGAGLPDPHEADGFFITGSSSSVTDRERTPWMLRLEQLVREIVAYGAPLYGICFGHQIIAQALGGEVTKNPRGREMGTVEARVLPHAPRDPVFTGLDDRFAVNTTHLDTVARLPPGARVVAETDLEPHAAYVFGDTVKCVQFHPEIDGDAMRGWIDARAALLKGEGRDPRAMFSAATDTPGAGATLRNFVLRVVRRR